MASSTPNLGLTLPVGGEHVSRQIINANNVKIDEAVGPVPSGTDLQSQVTALNNNLSGLLSSASKASEADFNNCKTPGTYKGSNGTTSNMPTNGYFVMTVFQYSDNDLAQIAVEVNNGRMFVRSFYDNTTWTSWQELALKSGIIFETQSINSPSGFDGNQKESSISITPRSGYTAHVYSVVPNNYNSAHYLQFFSQPNSSNLIYLEHNLNSNATILRVHIMWEKA